MAICGVAQHVQAHATPRQEGEEPGSERRLSSPQGTLRQSRSLRLALVLLAHEPTSPLPKVRNAIPEVAVDS